MALTKGKHIVQEIEGIRCTLVETGVNEARIKFLKEILVRNNYDVKVEADKKEDPEAATTYSLGVTDIIFNPVIAIYARKLKLSDGTIITPAYWNQSTEVIDPRYWRFKKRA